MSHVYETADPDADLGGGRVLWGRLAVAGLAIALAFLLGRCSAPDGVPLAEFDEATQRAQSLQEQNTLLRAEVAAADAGGADDEGSDVAAASSGDGAVNESAADESSADESTADASTGDEPAADDSESDDTESSGETYTVEPGDTLAGIAEAIYGDSSQFDVIADANGITSATELAVGRELRIPPDPDAD